MNRPLCAWCQERPVKRRRLRYCSSRCYGHALRAKTQAARPKCAFCQEKPVSKKGGIYCCKSCDMLDRRGQPTFERARRAGWAKAMDRMRERHVVRLRARLDAAFAPVFAAHPEWTEAERIEILKAALQVWRRAYENGWKARDVRGRRTGAAA